MNSQQPLQGNRLETMLASEATLVPFPPGEYVICIATMEHPPKVLANSIFPCVQVAILPGSLEAARLPPPDDRATWLTQNGEQVALRVGNPGGLVLFTTYRPSEYATTGIRMDIKRLSTTPHPGNTAPQPHTTPFGEAQSLVQTTQAAPTPWDAMGNNSSPGAGMPHLRQPTPGFGGTPTFGQTLGYTVPPAPRPFTPPNQTAASTPTMRMAGHVEGEGDVAFDPGQGAGRPGSRRRLEAVALYAEGIPLQEIEYAAVGIDGQLMSWVSPPQFTGTRGTGAPIHGFAARLSGETARRFSIAYAGSFIGAGPVPPTRNGEILRSPIASDAIESLTVILEPKG